MKTRKLIAGLLCLSLLLVFGLVCGAEEPIYTDGFFHYIIRDGAVTITEYFGDEAEVYVPSHISGLPVEKIADGVFPGTSAVTVHLPATVALVERNAFPADTDVIYNSTQPVRPNPTPAPDSDREEAPRPAVTGLPLSPRTGNSFPFAAVLTGAAALAGVALLRKKL